MTTKNSDNYMFGMHCNRNLLHARWKLCLWELNFHWGNVQPNLHPMYSLWQSICFKRKEGRPAWVRVFQFFFQPWKCWPQGIREPKENFVHEQHRFLAQVRLGGCELQEYTHNMLRKPCVGHQLLAQRIPRWLCCQVISFMAYVMVVMCTKWS